MKTKPKNSEKAARDFDAKRFWRHYVATVDTDTEWDQSAPKPGRTSNRIFMFLLLFHVFLIASVVLFNLVADRPKPVFVDNSIASKNAAKPGTPAPAPTAGKSTPAAPVIPAMKGVETVEHRVLQGESMKSIADKYGSTQGEIAKLNQLEAAAPVRVGSVLQVPKPKEKTPPAIGPPTVQPTRVEEKIVAVQATTSPDTAKMFAAAEPEPSPKKAELAPMPGDVPAPKEEAIQSKPPQDKPKASAADSPPAEKAKPMEAKGPAKAEAPKPTETKAQVRPEAPKPKPTETKAQVRSDTAKPATATTKPAVSKSAEPAKPAPKATGTTHTVKPKETLYSISRKHGVNVNDLMKLNNISDPSKLREGVVLKVPAK